jgi:hypothetical protein
MMNFIRWNDRVMWVSCATGLALISILTGCNRDEPKVYQVPKETDEPKVYQVPKETDAPPVPPPAAQPDPMATPDAAQPAMASPSPMMAPAAAEPGLPQLKYQTPAGWQEKPAGDMRVASFTVAGANGQTADVSVIPLPVVGRDMELINMWRSRVQLAATSDPAAVNQAKPVTIGSDEGRLFEFVSDKPLTGKFRQRIVVAMLTRPAMSWFFKITGDDELVTAQKDKFLQFLKSVSFAEGAGASQPMGAPPAMPPSAMPGGNDSTGSIWTIPSGWQSVPPSQFLLAEYSVAGANGAKAEVNVAEMAGTGGGHLPNINRWRGQIGLGPLSDDELTKQELSVDVTGGSATVVDFTGTNAKTGAPTRLIGAIVAQNGQTWFYKLMGDQATVGQQKDAFTKFIQSANYANAR